MDKALIPLLVVAAGTAVWSENATRTPKLEILRSPTKVAIWKPDPYPVLTRYGDELPAPNVSNQSDYSPGTISLGSLLAATTNQTSDQTEENRTESVNATKVDESVHNKTHVVENSTTLQPHSMNMTCIRRDYEDDVAAVFKEDTGPIKTAMLVFNSTVQSSEGGIANVTELAGLQVINETIVDCGEYFKDEIQVVNL